MSSENKVPEEAVSEAIKEAHALCRGALKKLLEVAPEVAKFQNRASQRNTAENLGDAMNAMLRVCHDSALCRAANWSVRNSMDYDRDQLDAVVHAAVRNLR